VIDKPQFAPEMENHDASGETAIPPALQSLTGTDSRDKEQANSPKTNFVLGQESLAALCKFFELLDQWDHRRNSLETPPTT